MARNKFEVECLKFKHFDLNSQKEDDIKVLKELERYINSCFGNIVKNSSYYVENNERIYMFKFQKALPVEKVIKMLKVMFVKENWIVVQTHHNLSTGLYTVSAL